MDFFTQMFLAFIYDLLMNICSGLGWFISGFNTFVIQINQTEAVARVTLFTTALGASVSVLMVVKQILSTYGFGSKGDPDQDAMEIVFRVCLMLGAMGMNTWLFTELTKFVQAVANDITLSIGGGLNMDTVATVLSGNIVNAGDSFILYVVTGALLFCTIFFAFSFVLRGAEITLNKILLPIFALDLINANPEKWNMFIFQYGVSFGSHLVQLLCYQIFAYQLVHLDSSVMQNMLILLSWLVLSIKTPKILEKYIYASGAGQAISKGAGRLGQVIMYVGMRK